MFQSQCLCCSDTARSATSIPERQRQRLRPVEVGPKGRVPWVYSQGVRSSHTPALARLPAKQQTLRLFVAQRLSPPTVGGRQEFDLVVCDADQAGCLQGRNVHADGVAEQLGFVEPKLCSTQRVPTKKCELTLGLDSGESAASASFSMRHAGDGVSGNVDCAPTLTPSPVSVWTGR
jgi:hypothetical protein